MLESEPQLVHWDSKGTQEERPGPRYQHDNGQKLELKRNVGGK